METLLTLSELKIAYKTINKIMKNEHLSKDNSFIRVKNWLSTAICDIVVEDE